MDILNDYYPLHPKNNENSDSEDEVYIQKLDKINNEKKRKKMLTIDDFCIKYSDDMWYIWCIIKDYTYSSQFLDKLDYPGFCSMCYDNSSKY
jgi:hypothetical protein